MAGAMRFSTVELGELEAKIASAADRSLRVELGIFDTLEKRLLGLADQIAAAADATSAVDVTAALADLATRLDWSRPQVTNDLAFSIEGGRHPVVEAALKRDGAAFIANDRIFPAARPGAFFSSPARTWAASPPICARMR